MLQENAGELHLEEMIASAAAVDLPAVIFESEDGCACSCLVDCDCVMGCAGRGCADACRLCGARDDLWGDEGFKACGDPARCQARLLAAQWRVYRERNPYKQPSSILAARIALGEETRRVAPNQNEVQAND